MGWFGFCFENSAHYRPINQSNSIMVKRWLGVMAACIASLISTPRASAQSNPISFTGATYNQNFDTLPDPVYSTTFTGSSLYNVPAGPTGATTLAGWGFRALSGTTTTFRADDGSNASPGVYSYGSTASTERALGSHVSGAGTGAGFGAIFVNNTGSTINSITITYTGEQWQRGGNANSLLFSYSVGATSIADAGATFTAVAALNFAPIQTGSSIPLDGNLPANRILITATITGLNWTNTSNLVIRWQDSGSSGAGLAIDDFSLAVPEPGTVVAGVVALGMVGLAAHRRSAGRRTRKPSAA